MSWYKRISNAFTDAPVIPYQKDSRFVFFSDCHRGVGNHSTAVNILPLTMSAEKPKRSHFFPKPSICRG